MSLLRCHKLVRAKKQQCALATKSRPRSSSALSPPKASRAWVSQPRFYAGVDGLELMGMNEVMGPFGSTHLLTACGKSPTSSVLTRLSSSTLFNTRRTSSSHIPRFSRLATDGDVPTGAESRARNFRTGALVDAYTAYCDTSAGRQGGPLTGSGRRRSRRDST